MKAQANYKHQLCNHYFMRVLQVHYRGKRWWKLRVAWVYKGSGLVHSVENLRVSTPELRGWKPV